MANLDSLVSAAELNHRQLSSRTGRNQNWFNDAYNNNEDIYISSFTKVLSIVQQEHDLAKYKLDDIFDSKILAIALMMSRLSDENSDHIQNFILSEKELFIDLLGDWASIDNRNKLTEPEKEAMNHVKKVVSN